MFVVCNVLTHMQASIVSSLEELRLGSGHDGCISKNTIYGSDGKGSALVTGSHVPSSTGAAFECNTLIQLYNGSLAVTYVPC